MLDSVPITETIPAVLQRFTSLGGEAATAQYDAFEADLRMLLGVRPDEATDPAAWTAAIRHGHAYYAWSWDARAVALVPAVTRAIEAWAAAPDPHCPALLELSDFLFFIGWCFEASNRAQCRIVLPGMRAAARGFARGALGAPGPRRGPPRIALLCMFASTGNPMTLGPRVLIEALTGSPDQYDITLIAWRFADDTFLNSMKARGVTVVRTGGDTAEDQLAQAEAALRAVAPDILVTDMNNAVPLAVVSRRAAPAQIFLSSGMPAFPAFSLDAVFDSFGIGAADTGWERARLLPFRPPWDLIALSPPEERDMLAAERAALPAGRPLFGCYGRLVKLTDGYLRAVERILLAVPDARFVAGGTGDPAPILAFAGSSPVGDRIHVQARFVPGHAWGRLLDLFLDTWPLTGGESVRETMAKGCPVVALHSDEMPALDLQRDPALLAQDWDGFVAAAVRLLRDPLAREVAGRNAAAFAQRMADPEPFRRDVEQAIVAVLRDARRRVSPLRRAMAALGLRRGRMPPS